ncbi:MAG: hypothetical protein O3B47_02770 [bacterium]|nr:hypothetical protein [bacterium]
MEELDVTKIPAYQRKRSISARARKKPMWQAKRSRTNTKKESIKSHKSEQATFADIPARTLLPSEELFSAPILDDIPKKEGLGYREMKTCGMCEGYFDKIDVAIVKLTSPLREGDIIIFERQDGLFEQEIKSMQINRKDVRLARSGSDIGLKVALKPKVGAPVYKII